MKGLLFLLLFALCSMVSSAQKSIIEQGTEFITTGDYAGADQFLDSILKQDKRNVDALMMKGNVLLNYTWIYTSRYYFRVERAESVFDSTGINGSFFVPIIPDDTSRMIEKMWLQCLQWDSTRLDIRKGLCNLYSISQRTEDLKHALRQMKDYIIQNDENAFSYAEYARHIKARGRLDEAIQVYELIASMFPQLAGIRCDIAGEYFYEGRPNDVLRYLDSALSKPDIDPTTYLNAAADYSMLGYYDKALETFERYSEKDTLVEGEFYKALILFAAQDNNFEKIIQRFMAKATDESYYDEMQLARRLIPYAHAPFTIDDYRAMMEAKIPDYYKVLIMQRGMRQFKNSCLPFYQYGVFQCGNKNYSMATQFLEEAVNCADSSVDTAYTKLVYAYALYKNGENEAAIKYFSSLLNSPNDFDRQAATYIEGEILEEFGQKYGFTLIAGLTFEKVNTKYAWLAMHPEVTRMTGK